jgi:hypothetical protein
MSEELTAELLQTSPVILGEVPAIAEATLAEKKVTKKAVKAAMHASAQEDHYRSMDECLRLGANKVKEVGEWAWAHWQTMPAPDVLTKIAVLGYVYNKKRQWYQRPMLGARTANYKNRLDTESVFTKYAASDWMGRN